MGSSGGLSVELEGGDDASGLASMLADLLRDNLRDFGGRAKIARLTRGSVVFRAADHDLDVTIQFLGNRIVVRDGAEPGVTIVAGPWLAMAQLCSGQLPPFKAMRGGELDITPGRSLPTAGAAGFVLSVPESFYLDEEAAAARRAKNRQKAALAAALVVSVATLLLLSRGGRDKS